MISSRQRTNPSAGYGAYGRTRTQARSAPRPAGTRNRGFPRQKTPSSPQPLQGRGAVGSQAASELGRGLGRKGALGRRGAWLGSREGATVPAPPLYQKFPLCFFPATKAIFCHEKQLRLSETEGAKSEACLLTLISLPLSQMARTQKNKATAHHLGLLKARLAKLRRELITPKGGGGSGTGEGASGLSRGPSRSMAASLARMSISFQNPFW